MAIFEEISKFIFLLGAVQGFLLALFIFKKRENHSANVILGLLIIAMSLDLLEGFYFAGKYFYEIPHLLGITFAFPYLYGPLILIYVIIIGSGDQKFKMKHLYHFLPFILVTIAAFFELYLESGEYKIALAEERAVNIPGKILSMLIPVHGVIYTYFSIKQVGFFNKNLKRTFSNIENINLDWLAYLVFATMIIWSIVIITYILTIIYGEALRVQYFIYIAVAIFIYSMGYKGLKQEEIFIESTESKNDLLRENPLNAKAFEGQSLCMSKGKNMLL